MTTPWRIGFATEATDEVAASASERLGLKRFLVATAL
jgi:hypothetical protein